MPLPEEDDGALPEASADILFTPPKRVKVTEAMPLPGDDDGELPEEASADILFTPPNKKSTHKRTVKTGTNIWVPHDVLKSPALVSVATRNQVTPIAPAAIVTTLIETCGGDTSKLSLHWRTSFRYRAQTQSTIADKIHAEWKAPHTAFIHWDGKLMDTLSASDDAQEERLPILLSGIGGTKLLGVPTVPTKSNEAAGDHHSRDPPLK